MGWTSLVYTSVDDCRSSLSLRTKADLPELRKALAMSKKLKEKTRAKILEAKIRQLEKK